MSADDPLRLTDRQIDCLRLVGQGLSSKEIAAELGISHHTVDLHLKRAIRTLGVATRRDAARRWDAIAAQEGGAGSVETRAPAPEPATLPEAAAEAPADGDTQPLDTQPAGLAEPAPIAAIMTPAGHDRRPRLRLPFLRQGRQYNDLEPAARLGWIAALSLAMLLAAANFLNGLRALHDLVF